VRNTSDLNVVFVGCGGTFFMGMPYFKVLMRRYDPRRVLFVDPDKVLGKNQNRQWPHKGSRGEFKSLVATSEFDLGCHYGLSFREFIRSPVEDFLPGDVLLVVNVDNDEARLEVREWVKERPGWAGMVVSGCEANYGQAYWGAWKNGVAIHDWRMLHKDVGREEEVEQGHTCMPQTAEANALTGVLAGLALADALACYEGDRSFSYTHSREYYWSMDALKRVKSWTLEVVRQGGGR